MVQVRVLAYFQMVLVLPWAGAVFAVGAWCWHRCNQPWRAPLTALVLIVALGGHIVAGALLLGKAGRETVTSWQDSCDWSGLGTILGELAPPVTGTVATMVFPGPEIAWRSGLGVVSAPYHRNTQGILDVHALFLSGPSDAEAIARARDIELIVLCEAAPAGAGTPGISIRRETVAYTVCWPRQHHPNGLPPNRSKFPWRANSWSTEGLEDSDSGAGR